MYHYDQAKWRYQTGYPEYRINKSVLSKPEAAKRGNATLPRMAIGCDTVAGAVLRAWHRESSYVDENADPIPLFPRRGKVSLYSLVSSQDANVDAQSLVREMRRTGLIRRDARGRYMPVKNAATIGQMHPLAIDHVAKTVMRLVETVNRNMRASAAKTSLIERYAHVPDLSPREAKAFAEFSRQQGAAYLESIEDWLESRRIRYSPSAISGTRRKGLSAGVHIFAHLGGEQDIRPKLAVRRRLPTPSRAARA